MALTTYFLKRQKQNKYGKNPHRSHSNEVKLPITYDHCENHCPVPVEQKSVEHDRRSVARLDTNVHPLLRFTEVLLEC